jgi:hypothetical protein
LVVPTNIVKDGIFECGARLTPFSEEWNFDAEITGAAIPVPRDMKVAQAAGG